mgnify:CR=1 FL=1
MAYPEKGAGYHHMPKWAAKERASGGFVEEAEEMVPGGAVTAVEEDIPMPRERPHLDAAKRLLADELDAADKDRMLNDFVNKRSSDVPARRRDDWGRDPIRQHEERERQRLAEQGQADV